MIPAGEGRHCHLNSGTCHRLISVLLSPQSSCLLRSSPTTSFSLVWRHCCMAYIWFYSSYRCISSYAGMRPYTAGRTSHGHRFGLRCSLFPSYCFWQSPGYVQRDSSLFSDSERISALGCYCDSDISRLPPTPSERWPWGRNLQ